MKLKIFTSLGLVCLLLLFGCKNRDNGGGTTGKTHKQVWTEDLDYFENVYLNESSTFPKDSIPSCKLLLSTLKSQIDLLTDNQIILQLSRCVAMANNGHTTIPLGFMAQIPMRFYRFSDGLYVIKTDQTSKDYLGAKLLKINSMEIEEVEIKLNPYLSGIDRWKEFKATDYLSSPEILHGIGLSERNEMTLTLFLDKDTVELTSSTQKMKSTKDESWSNLYADPNEPNWHHVLSENAAQPLYLKHMKEGVFYTFLDSENLAYFSINGYWHQAGNFKAQIKAFIEELKQKPNYDVVLDLRYFTGGNYTIPVDLASKPPELIDPDQNIFLITSNMTFSAGLVTAARIKYYAGDKIIIVGEEVGDNLKFWAERDDYTLPNSGIRILDADAEHDWQDDTFTFGTSFWVNAFYGVPAKSLKVDQEIKMSFEDYMAGKDPIFEWITTRSNSK